MDDLIAKLKSAEQCEVFETNALAQGRPDLAAAARKRAIEYKAQQYGAQSDVERECLQAVYAYERGRSAEKGRKTYAARTWQMIKRHGVLEAVERTVNRPDDPIGYKTLRDMGLEDYAFEAVVMRHPTIFSAKAVESARARVNQWKQVE